MKICPRHFGVWDMACKHGCVMHCVLAHPELVNAQAARWEWARVILSGQDHSRALLLINGMLRGESVETVIDNAIAAERSKEKGQ
jgi:hypothetical protein